MNIIRRLVRLLALAVLLAVGITLIVAAATTGNWIDVIHVVRQSRWETLCAGAIFVLLAVGFALSELRTRRRERFLSFTGEDGVVSISTAAVEDYVAKLAGEFPSVVRMRPHVRPRRGGIDVTIRVKVKSGSQVHEMCQLLQQRARERIVDGLGITEVRRVEVSVDEIVSEHRPI